MKDFIRRLYNGNTIKVIESIPYKNDEDLMEIENIMKNILSSAINNDFENIKVLKQELSLKFDLKSSVKTNTYLLIPSVDNELHFIIEKVPLSSDGDSIFYCDYPTSIIGELFQYMTEIKN